MALFKFFSFKHFLLLSLVFSLSSCSRKPEPSLDPLLYYQRENLSLGVVDLKPWLKNPLTAIHMVDINGMKQTYSSRERLKSFSRLDPLQNQPYQQLNLQYKNMRGESMGILARYYPSGSIMQLLTTFGGSARGIYCEWFENGQLRLKGRIVGGKASLGDQSQDDYLFDGICYAWNEHGDIVAQIEYDGGKRSGDYITYHEPNKLWYKTTYKDNKLEGNLTEYTPEGHLLLDEWYKNGLLHGQSKRYYSNGRLQAKESYTMGSLKSAYYWSYEGENYTPRVENYAGVQLCFKGTKPMRFVQTQRGRPEGRVFEFNEFGELAAEYQLHQGLKEGLSIEYFIKDAPSERARTQVSLALFGKILFEPHFWKEFYWEDFDWDLVKKSHGSAPYITMMWSGGLLQGLAQTWYPSGQLQSEREILEETTHGRYNSYYYNGDLRAMERYEHGVLYTGRYWRLGDTDEVSHVEKGSGIATFFDDYGYNKHEVQYTEGTPSLPVSAQR